MQTHTYSKDPKQSYKQGSSVTWDAIPYCKGQLVLAILSRLGVVNDVKAPIIKYKI